MISKNLLQDIKVFGNYQNGGAYVLKINIKTEISLNFGRFNHSQIYQLPSGNYLYIGSALTKADRPALLQRVSRHTTRTNPHPPHKIRKSLLAYALQHNIPPEKILLKTHKKKHWHMDYLFDNYEVEIVNIFLIPSSKEIESILARSLMQLRSTSIPIPNLGASDKKNETHFLALSSNVSPQDLSKNISDILD